MTSQAHRVFVDLSDSTPESFWIPTSALRKINLDAVPWDLVDNMSTVIADTDSRILFLDKIRQ